MSFNAIRENKILVKISESTVVKRRTKWSSYLVQIKEVFNWHKIVNVFGRNPVHLIFLAYAINFISTLPQNEVLPF